MDFHPISGGCDERSERFTNGNLVILRYLRRSFDLNENVWNMLAMNVAARDGSALLDDVIVYLVHLAAFKMAVVVQKAVQ